MATNQRAPRAAIQGPVSELRSPDDLVVLAKVPTPDPHPELGRESLQRPWYCVLRRGRVGRCQVFQNPDAHTLITDPFPMRRYPFPTDSRGVEQPGSSSGS